MLLIIIIINFITIILYYKYIITCIDESTYWENYKHLPKNVEKELNKCSYMKTSVVPSLIYAFLKSNTIFHEFKKII